MKSSNSIIDLCVHHLIRLRLANAGPQESDALCRQLGAVQVAVAGEPDLVLRFSDQGPNEELLRILGDRDVGYTDDRFWILRGSHRRQLAMALPMERLGGPCELVCRRPMPSYPLLQAIVNLTALVKGYLPLHASAFRHAGSSVLVTGWSKGGKTESLVGFGERGAEYVGDEWLHISGDGQTMTGAAAPMQLWDWHLDAKCIRARLRAGQRLKLLVTRLLDQAGSSVLARRVFGAKTASRLSAWAHTRRHVQVMPQRLFGDGLSTSADCPARIFLVASHASPRVVVRPMAAREAAARMAASLEDEFASLQACYRQYRFAFPAERNPWLDSLPELLHNRLQSVFADKEVYVVWHPYPVSPRQMYEALVPYVGESSGAKASMQPASQGDFASAASASTSPL